LHHPGVLPQQTWRQRDQDGADTPSPLLRRSGVVASAGEKERQTDGGSQM